MNDTPRRPSLRKAINDKCKSCIYDPYAGNGAWRQQVEACTVTGCPLYPIRPTSKAKGGELGEESCLEAALNEDEGDSSYPSSGYIEKSTLWPSDSPLTA